MSNDDEPSDQSRRPGRRGFADWYVGIEPRRAGWFGLTFWASAVGALVLYTHSTLLGIMGFTLLECWLIGTGCLGVPLLVTRLLGNRLTANACKLIGAASATAALLLTGLIAFGQLQVAPITAAFIVIMPEALAIHMINGLDTLTRIKQAVTAARAEERAIRDRDVKAAYVAALHAAFEALQGDRGHVDELLSTSTGNIQKLTSEFLEELDARRARHADPRNRVPLRLVSQGQGERAGHDPRPPVTPNGETPRTLRPGDSGAHHA
jgi:hypothetical protein